MKPRAVTITLVLTGLIVASVLAVTIAQSGSRAHTYSPALEADVRSDSKVVNDVAVPDTDVPLTLRNQTQVEDPSAPDHGTSRTQADGEPAPGVDTVPVTSLPPVSPSGTRFGLTLEERKTCFWELVEAEDRAVAEAERTFPLDADPPNTQAHVALRYELLGTYEDHLMDAYSITADQLDAIGIEGVTSAWPMPPL